MKNNYQEEQNSKSMQDNLQKDNNSYDLKEYYYTANNFYNKNEIDKKYNYYLSSLNKEKKDLNELFPSKRNEQIEKLLEEEKNIEDENIQRLKELRNKYLSSVKTLDEEKEIHNYFSKNASYDAEENKLWKISYPKKDVFNMNSRNSFDSLNQNQNQFNSNSTNNDINIGANKLNHSNSNSNINNNVEINMSIYERKNSQSLNENQSYNTYNNYKINNSEINISEDLVKIPKYENIIPNQNNNELILLHNYQKLEDDYNKLKYDYNNLKVEYDKLVEKYNLEKNINKGFMDKKDLYNDYVIKEKEELKNINSNYEYILSPLINYINDIDYVIDKNKLKKIDLSKLKKNIKSLFQNKNSNNTKEHPLYPFLKLLQNYKNIIYNNENIKNLNQNNKNSKNLQKKGKYESILNGYNIKENINNIKFKSLNNTKNNISKSIAATPITYQNEKIKKIFSNRKNLKLFKSEKYFDKNKNKTNSVIKHQNIFNTSVPKEIN